MWNTIVLIKKISRTRETLNLLTYVYSKTDKKKANKIPWNTLLTEEYSTHCEPAPMQTPYYGWEWLGMARIYIEMTGNGKKQKK